MKLEEGQTASWQMCQAALLELSPDSRHGHFKDWQGESVWDGGVISKVEIPQRREDWRGLIGVEGDSPLGDESRRLC